MDTVISGKHIGLEIEMILVLFKLCHLLII